MVAVPARDRTRARVDANVAGAESSARRAFIRVARARSALARPTLGKKRAHTTTVGEKRTHTKRMGDNCTRTSSLFAQRAGAGPDSRHPQRSVQTAKSLPGVLLLPFLPERRGRARRPQGRGNRTSYERDSRPSHSYTCGSRPRASYERSIRPQGSCEHDYRPTTPHGRRLRPNAPHGTPHASTPLARPVRMSACLAHRTGRMRAARGSSAPDIW